MQKFKIGVSKLQKKYNIVISANSESEAREKIHKEGYSILNVESFLDTNLKGKKFQFKIILNGKEKQGIILGKDIFKVYIKLKRDLKYNIKELYLESDKDKSTEYKQKILKNLEEGYDNIKIKPKKTKKTKEKIRNNIDNFYLKKELEEVYILIDLVLKKLNFFINKSNDINLNQKEKIRKAYNNIIKLKKSTNLFKLKEIGELALLKIGELELRILEKKKTIEAKNFLKETNKLLKQIGSKKQFIEKDKDIALMSKNLLNKYILNNKIFKKKNKKINKKDLDKDSYSFLKTLLLLKKYKSRLKQNNIDLVKNINVLIFPFGKNLEKKERLTIKRKVIKQNIYILKAKKNGKLYSYTGIIKGYKNTINNIILLINSLLNYLLFIILIYSFIFVIYYNSIKYGYFLGNFNNLGIYYFLFILLFFILSFFLRGIFSFFFNFVFFFFIVIFSIINF